MNPAEAEGPENNDLRQNGVKPEPETLEEVELATSSVSNIQTTVGKADLAVPVDKAPVLSMPNSVATVAGGARKEDTNASPKEERSADTHPAKNTRSITMKHHNGETFMLPWALCQTQKGMEDLIKLSFGNDEKAKKEIIEGKYELYTTSGAKVLPQFWEILVEPGWEVTIRLQSRQDSDGNSLSDFDNSSDTGDRTNEETEKFEISYTTKLKYTVAWYIKEQGGERSFLYSKSYDEPVVLEKMGDKGPELPILEEITSVVVPASRRWEGRTKPPKGRPELNDGDTVGQTSLRIHSPFLLNALLSTIKYSSKAPSGGGTENSGDGVFPHPYEDLFHHKQELSDYKKLTTGPRANHTPEYNAECDRHIDFLLQYLDQEPNVRLRLLEAKWAQKIPTTTFAGFWLLMKPGSDVYVEEDGQLNAYVVESVSGGVDYLSPSKWPISAQGYSVCVWNLKYDGKVIGRKSKVIRVPIFDNDREILSLPLFPTRIQDKNDGGARRKQLIQRGRKAFRFAQRPTYLEYTGMGRKPGWKQYNRARVVVQHESEPLEKAEYKPYWPFNERDKEKTIGDRARAPRCKCSECGRIDAMTEKYIPATFSDYDNIDPNNTGELSDHQYMLCMSHMSGFILKDRVYDLLDISSLVEVNIVENAIDRLVMRPETNKDTIKAIVKTYADSSQVEHFNADFIQGKGEGQIFLLHGPPGTGKTLTAESVAEYTRRPLLSITAADLGHEPAELERNLLRFFNDARDWDAIVLLDEADVYLERRSAHDLRRNSIVSIFLRAMDYFQGILFLTTNRVGHFDEAFMSRIHVSIGYERLDDDARGKIWDNLFAKLKEDHKNGGPEILYEYDAKQYVKKDSAVKKLQWNGREIRNAFQTAVALAVFDSKMAIEKGARDDDSIPEIKERHLSQVVSMSRAFKDYITATHEGIEDADMAYKLGIRHDRIGNEMGGAVGKVGT